MVDFKIARQTTALIKIFFLQRVCAMPGVGDGLEGEHIDRRDGYLSVLALPTAFHPAQRLVSGRRLRGWSWNMACEPSSRPLVVGRACPGPWLGLGSER